MNMGGVKIIFLINICLNFLNLMCYYIICIYYMLFILVFCYKKWYKKINIVCLFDGVLLVFKLI